jgi:hypothetical protein
MRAPKVRGMSLTGRVPHSARRTIGPRMDKNAMMPLKRKSYTPVGLKPVAHYSPKNSKRGVTV